METYLALGSNMGDSLGYLKQAIEKLNDHANIQVIDKSIIYETDPYGDVPQDNYLNAVIRVNTDLSPHELLKVVNEIEANLDRERLIRWGPRTIDIDILLMGELEMDTPDLIIPHKEITKRSFVLIPLKDVYTKQHLLGKTLDEWINESGNADEVRQTNESWD
ncbi:2-amino-4-hydroxy-6-hydroxymethyldihydropteridine diphosphokinase [Vagococcus bubulae]|uniref:2-amino-4-hydroxy-6-hydroxymethyldihydropteridine diphosphokinase n=2 Tax=Vagococcus bubulae TaxID=1977868 RepID=A0A429ZEU8_9ENTE|nr:2-amino-4-hydroxy-6-hydroxymethyldihydropteridine diphosphokinase [Vagococcus bubulae]RST92236.1 2-amino-4-hydroxy-6-hydroxymethyldihydropteridine diphosphokinase [Vagococcus bubulae]